MPHFLLRLTPPRPGFPSDASAVEMEAMVAHGVFWQSEADRGVALAVGPVADPAGIWGMALVEVEDDSAARSLAAQDPVIEAGLGFAYEVMPILSFIQGRRAAGPIENVEGGPTEGRTQ